MRGIWKSGIIIKSKAVTARVSGGVDFTVLAREVGSLKMYDWKTFLAALLLGGAGMAIHLMKLLQGDMVSLAWLILFAYLICRGIYESVTEQGFRRGKERNSQVKQVYQERFGKLWPVVSWSVVIGWGVIIILALVSAPAWIIVAGGTAVLFYQLILTVIIRGDLRKYR